MKKKTLIAYLLTLALCLSLLAGLAGCGNKQDPSEDPGKPNGEPGKPGASETADPEFVYVPEYVEVQGDFTSSFDNMIYSDGRFLASMYTKIGERELEEGEVLEWEGQNWIWGQKLYWLSLDGTTEEITGYEPLDWKVEIPREEDDAPEAPAEGDAPVTAEPVPVAAKVIAGYSEEYGGAYMQRLMLSPAGDIVAVEMVYRYWYDGPDDIEMYTDEWFTSGYSA